MKPTYIRARVLVIAGAIGLIGVVSSGGALLASAEGIDYVSGLRLVFSTVSTTGFGPGPQTTTGTLLVFAVFAAGVVCWFPILLACFEVGLRRYHASVDGAGLGRLVGDRWPPSMIPKGRG